MKDPLQKSLFEENLETKLSADEKLNKENNHGITRNVLNRLKYHNLRDIFYGLENVTVPEHMLQHMNTSEILALYIGVYKFKDPNRDCTVTKQVTSKSDVPFEDLVSGLVSKGYASEAIRSTSRLGYYGHSTAQNALKSRMALLDSSVKNELIHELELEYRKSNAENSMDFDFSDPNIDGRNCSLYVDEIMRRVKKEYKKK